MPGFHVLNARDNSLLHYIFLEHANADAGRFQIAIQREAQQIRNLLASKQVRYDDLKSALVPSAEGKQVAFLYDWRADTSWNYAVGFASHYLPALRKKLYTSVLHGDLHEMSSPMPVEALNATLVRGSDDAVNWTTQYVVLFSNLRPGDVDTLHAALSEVRGYSGYLDVSFGGAVRDYLASTVTPLWVVANRKVIVDHGSDDPLVDNQDTVGYDLPRYDFDVVSLISVYFTAFMSYKVESSNAFQAQDDRILNLAAITGQLVDIDATEVVVHPDKVDKYLLVKRDKLRLMTSIGLQEVNPERLAELAREKLAQSYIYDFRFAPDGAVTFAVSAEFEKPDGGMARRLLALKYDRSTRAISLVSMY